LIKWDVGVRGDDFKVVSRFRALQENCTNLAFVLWSGNVEYLIRVDRLDGQENNDVLEPEPKGGNKCTDKCPTLNNTKFQTIEVFRDGRLLTVLLDNDTVINDTSWLAEHPIDAVGWRPGNCTIRVESLEATTNSTSPPPPVPPTTCVDTWWSCSPWWGWILVVLGLVGLCLVMVMIARAQDPKDTLATDEKLEQGEKLVSKNAKYSLVMQADGNLVGYEGDRVFWQSETNGKGEQPYEARMQPDGTFAVYGKDKKIWTMNEASKGGKLLKLQNDRNIVIYDQEGQAVCDSETRAEEPMD
jgi:hypothetical protein